MKRQSRNVINSRNMKSKFDRIFYRRVAFAAIILLLLLIIFNIINSIVFKQKHDKISVLLDNTLLNLEKEVFIEDDIIYISKTDIKNNIDENIYYISEDREIITTFNTHVALLKIDYDYMYLNDADIDIKGRLKEIDGEIYLPLNDLSIVYDLEIEYIEDSKRVILDFTTKEKSKAFILKNVILKENLGMFSKNIEKVKRGKSVIVVGTEKKYTKVRTKIGNVGYVKTKHVSEIDTVRYDMPYEKAKLDMDYITDLKNSKKTSVILDTYSERKEIIQECYKQIINNKDRGININFKEIDDAESFYRLIIEMVPRFKEAGFIVVVTLNENLDRERLGKIADYIVD